MSQVITCDSSRKWHILAPLTPFLSHPSTCDTPSVICTSLWHGSLNMLRLYTVIYWRGYFTGDITKNIEQDISLKPSQNTLHTISNYISNARWCSCNDTATKTCTFSWASPKVQLETYVTVLGYSLTNLVTLATFVNTSGDSLAKCVTMSGYQRISCHLLTAPSSLFRKYVREQTLHWLRRPVEPCVRNWGLTSGNF